MSSSSSSSWEQIIFHYNNVADAVDNVGTQIFGGNFLLFVNISLVVLFTAAGDFVEQWKNMVYSTNTSPSPSLSLSAAGKQQQQQKQQRSASYDWHRTWNQSLAACPDIVAGLIYHYWYVWLDNNFPATTVAAILLKVVVDLGIASPVAWTTFFACLTLLERGTWRKFKSRAFDKGLRLYLAEWTIWPPIQTLNFYFLPTKFRVFCDMIVQICFDVYASYLLYDE